MGMDYMFRDSQIATAILNHFINLNEAILPLHDSFVVRESMKDNLYDCMTETYLKHTGYEPFELDVRVAA